MLRGRSDPELGPCFFSTPEPADIGMVSSTDLLWHLFPNAVPSSASTIRTSFRSVNRKTIATTWTFESVGFPGLYGLP